MITEKRRENILLKLKYHIDKKKYEDTCQFNYLIDSIVPLLRVIERTSESEVDDEVVDMAYDIVYYVILMIEELEYNLATNKVGIK